MKTISIITPVYKAEEYLGRCINSILAQSVPDFELILIDDGSPDRCGEICDEYALRDARIKVIHQENRGQAAARNRALDIAEGEYIGFVDSDDYVHPRYLEVLLDNAGRCHAQVSICAYRKVDGPDAVEPLKGCPVNRWEGKDFVRKGLTGQIPNKVWLLCDKLFHRSCFAQIRLPEGRINEDNATVYRILYEAESVAECDEILYYYYQNPDSTVNQMFRRKNLDWLLVPQEMIAYFTEHEDPLLTDKCNRMYLSALEDMFRKVHENLDDPDVERELKKKLRLQYRHEKKRYPMTIRTHPGIFEILFPAYSYCYWTVAGVLKKFAKR